MYNGFYECRSMRLCINTGFLTMPFASKIRVAGTVIATIRGPFKWMWEDLLI